MGSALSNVGCGPGTIALSRGDIPIENAVCVQNTTKHRLVYKMCTIEERERVKMSFVIVWFVCAYQPACDKNALIIRIRTIVRRIFAFN